MFKVHFGKLTLKMYDKGDRVLRVEIIVNNIAELRCGKGLVERIGKTRRYRMRRPGIRTLAALLILREQVIKPVLAGVCRPKRGRPPKNVHPLDVHYQKLQREMLATFQTLKIAA